MCTRAEQTHRDRTVRIKSAPARTILLHFCFHSILKSWVWIPSCCVYSPALWFKTDWPLWRWAAMRISIWLSNRAGKFSLAVLKMMNGICCLGYANFQCTFFLPLSLPHTKKFLYEHFRALNVLSTWRQQRQAAYSSDSKIKMNAVDMLSSFWPPDKSKILCTFLSVPVWLTLCRK